MKIALVFLVAVNVAVGRIAVAFVAVVYPTMPSSNAAVVETFAAVAAVAEEARMSEPIQWQDFEQTDIGRDFQYLDRP